LGLSLAAGIAERHGARIHVETEEGRGSRFRITFPDALASQGPKPNYGLGEPMGTTSPRSPASAPQTGNRSAIGG
jgi:hypothetical protein